MEYLKTKIISTNKEREDFLEIKRRLISEAVDFPSGIDGERIKTVVNELSGNEASFLKPGKEASRKKPNIYDMYPMIRYNGSEVAEKFSFEDVWEYLIKIHIIHKGTFTKVLVLLYRLCFFNDHKELNGEWRYLPTEKIYKLIVDLDELILKEGFEDKFKETRKLTLFQMLLFVDLLAWNEDVKYNANKERPYFKNYSESKQGRTNTILSIISAPLLISEFIEDVISKTQVNGVINVKLITGTIQKFVLSRGLCVLSGDKIQTALEPYLI